MGECSHRMTLHRYSMLVDLAVEGFAERDGVSGAIFDRRARGMIWGKPQVEMIKKVKTRRIDQAIRIGVIVGAEEDRGCEDSLEALNHPSIMTTIGSKTKEIEHLEGSIKADGTAFLLDSQGRYPYGDQAVLTEGQTKLGMSRNLEKELSVPSGMSQLVGLWAGERQAAEDKGACVEGEFLLSGVALLAGEADGFELPEPPFRHTEGGKTGANCGRNGRQKSVSVRVSVDPVNRGI
jgi:hypothetical protein